MATYNEIIVSDDLLIGNDTPYKPAHRHSLAGTVSVNGSPSKKRIVVINRITMEYLAVTDSDAQTGMWEITHLPEYDERSLLVLAFDDTGEFNAEIADFVSQVATA